MAEIGNEKQPASAQQLADKEGIDKNYAEVWLHGMVGGKIIQCNSTGDGFWIAEENMGALTGDVPASGLVFTRLIPIYSSHYQQAVDKAKGKEVVGSKHDHGHGHSHGHEHGHEQHKAEGGHDHGQAHGGGHAPHDHHSTSFPLMELLSKTMYKKHLIPDYVPLLGVQDKVEHGGIEVLDVGCGSGFHLCEFAKKFPKSNFTGIDISPKAIERAQEVAKEYGLQNVKFEVISGEKMPDEWTKKFDWITSFNSIHDHQHPQIAINEISRVMKDDGRYTMLEINRPVNPFNQGKDLSPTYSFFAATGIFSVLANRGETEVFKWTNTLAQKMLKEAGFTKIEPIEPSFFDANILYICTK